MIWISGQKTLQASSLFHSSHQLLRSRNLNPVPAATTTSVANCTVELQFFDSKGALVSQTVVPNFAPGAATSFDLTRTSVTSETAVHAEIRGVVVVNPSPTPVASPATVGYCTVVTTLEIFDATTGSTVALTSDTRAMGTAFVVPAFSAAPLR